jgi:hypothetical protein
MKFILSLIPLLAANAAAMKLLEGECGGLAKFTVGSGVVQIPVTKVDSDEKKAAIADAYALDACTMKIKTQGGGVKALQDAINHCYISLLKDPLKTDGDWGVKTDAAYKLVQEKIGVPTDGTYGPAIRAKLQFFDGTKCVAFGK